MEAAKYAECCKSHLRFWGKPDGCQEYKECTASPLTCEICGCHRSFHRKVEVAAVETQIRYKKAEVVCTKCHENLGLQRFSTTSPAKGSNYDQLIKRKTISVLEEFFRVKDDDLEEALLYFGKELIKSPDHHPEVVREAISLALEKGPPCDDRVSLLIACILFHTKVVKVMDIGRGCRLYATSLCDIAIGIPKAPEMFGKILGNLFIVGAFYFKDVSEILGAVKDIDYERAVLGAVMKVAESHDFHLDF